MRLRKSLLERSFGRGLHSRGGSCRSCMLSVSKRTLYRRMKRYWLRALNFSNISDDELDRTWRKRPKVFSSLWRTNVEVSSQRKRHQRGITKTQTPKTHISDLRPRKLRPLEFFFFNIFIANLSQFLAPNVLWSRNVHRQQPEIKKRDIYLLRFIAVALIKQWKTNKV